MITRNMARFMAAFEEEMEQNGIEKAIEFECGKDYSKAFDYED